MYNFFNTSQELAESSVNTAVLPLGSVEPKGPHLPVGFDLILANRFVKDFCTGKAVYLLPVFPFSTAMETRGFCGTVSLQQQTLWDIVSDIAANLTRHGFKRLVILDFSNYNWILKHAVRELNLNKGMIQAVWVNPKEFAKAAVEPDLLPDYGGGALETSLTRFLGDRWLYPPLEDFDPHLPREYIDYQGLAAVAPKGFWGKPSRATAEMGERLYRVMNAYLLPALPILTSWGHIRFRGTITFSAMTARRVLEDIAESLYSGGYRTAVIVNIHGGNWILKPTMIEINRRHEAFRIISTGDILSYRGQVPVEQLHACESEASFIQAFYPECFKADRVVDFSPKCPASAFDFVGIGGVSPHGVWGYPSRATAAKGYIDLERKVSEAAAYIRRVLWDINASKSR